MKMKSFMREKKTVCGPHFMEVDIFQYSENQAAAHRKKRKKREKVTSPKQHNLNDKRARRYLNQLMKANFGDGDLHLTLTYNEAHLPETVEAASREAANFLRRVKYLMDKRGLPPLRYILVTEYSEGDEGAAPVRMHHHVIFNGGAIRNEVEDLWRDRRRKGEKVGAKKGYANADRLQGEDNGFAALCHYLTKHPHRKKRWTCSQNLERPIILPTNDSRYSRRKVARIGTEPVDVDFWQRQYPGYELINEQALKREYHEESGWHLTVFLKKVERCAYGQEDTA